MRSYMGYKKRLLFFLIIFLISKVILFAADIQVSAALEKYDVYEGESFIFQITVKGSNTPEEPGLSGFDDFSTSFLGGYDQSSQMITIINGKQTVTVNKAYVFQYRLTPKKTGTLFVPSVMIKVEGRNYMTEPIPVTVRKPEDIADYKLKVRLARTTCYIGEKVNVTVTWYIANQAKGPINFTVPLFDDNSFDVLPSPGPLDPDKEYITLAMGNEQVTVVEGSGTLGGRSYTTYSFKKILVPKKPGRINAPAATVSFQGVPAGRKQYDIWGRPVLSKLVIPSNTLSITIKPLPETGKPVNYSGLIGNYSISVKAAPVNVRVGDPITLTLTLKGDGYLEDAELPPLHEMPELNADFKIPRDIAPGEVAGNEVVFIQTLRAVHDSITAIPPVEIPFFNVKTGRYDVIKTKLIPISVQPATSELSVLDMEGKDSIELKREIEIWEEGIAHNYEGYEVLRKQSYGLGSLLSEPGFLFLVLFPIFAYLVLVYIFRFSPLVRRDMTAVLVKKTLDGLTSTLDLGIAGDIGQKLSLNDYLSKLLEELRTYLGAKLKTKAESLTFKDIEKPLQSHGISKDTIIDLKKVFETCEASHYAGDAFLKQDITELSSKTREVVTEIERSFT